MAALRASSRCGRPWPGLGSNWALVLVLGMACFIGAMGALEGDAAMPGQATLEALRAAAAADEPALADSEATGERLYQAFVKHFVEKRRHHMAAAEHIFAKPLFERRFALTKPLLDEIFRQLHAAQGQLASNIDVAQPELPDEPAQLEALIQVWQNAAFLADLALRLPDQVHALVDKYPVRVDLVRWAVTRICLPARIYQEQPSHRRALELLLQEMQLTDEPDPNYENPFSELSLIRGQRDRLRQAHLESVEIKRVLHRQLARAPQIVTVP
ncbi:uncharacterized protein MONBRDRAFT_22695 [Monosiga brevicollis MX1]|uniref:Uncharacterized protein n=1 Tax=Monosiga brevicollis TaxID=81824 RepID=A9URT3_MONBE|nr:uncharacterized protein MONBRDRAFT_22695 [Monosiga brevicollis MX1]EDQ91981.1 predicted protein [Monosiga brevicollis MX1]|eukprot:XP_001743267.1 hypothetical protein [Monosiga brevicollis MX1]